MLSNVQIRLLHGVGYRSWDTFCLRDTAINCLGFRVYSHDKDSSCETSAASTDTSVVASQSKSPRGGSVVGRFSPEETSSSDKLRTRNERGKMEKSVGRWRRLSRRRGIEEELALSRTIPRRSRADKVRISTGDESVIALARVILY